MTTLIPASHLDLVQQAVHAVLTTMMPDGTPQSSLVWTDYDGQCLLINTTLERQKGRNMQRNPRVALLVIDPRNANRWVSVRGVVLEITTEGAEEHADKLTQRYCPGKCKFYGDVYPPEQREQETRVLVKIEPVKVSLDAIFK